MKKRFIFILFLFSISAVLFGQDSASTVKNHRKLLSKPIREYAGDSVIPAGPNEFAFNMAPLFTTLLGSSSNGGLRYSLFYKRSLKNQRAVLRIGIVDKTRSLFVHDTTLDQYLYFDQTDSTRTESIFLHTLKTGTAQLNLGFEWRSKRTRRWSTYFSIDAIGGYFYLYNNLQNISQKLNSTGSWAAIYDNDAIAIYRAFNWFVGVSSNLGLRYAFNKRWVISIQSGTEVSMLFAKQYVRNENSVSRNPTLLKSSIFNIDSPGVMNEFALTFRF